LAHWAALLRATLASRALDASIVVGFRKFASYAVARNAEEACGNSEEACAGIRVFDDPEDEQEAAWRVPLHRLAIAPKARDLLGKLGVRSVGDLVRLPADGVERRFRKEIWQLYRLARGELEVPFEPRLPLAPVEREVELGYVEKDAARLLAVIERELPPLLEQLAREDRALARIEVTLFLEDGEPHRECLRTAVPTLDVPRILDLLRLRFESLGARLGERLAQRFGRRRKRVVGITDLKLRVEGARASREQLELFRDHSVRDLRAGDRALASLRAEFGESTVVAACPRDGHLPEAGFVWKRLEKVVASQGASQGASPSDRQSSQLVRRLYARPHPLPPRPRHEPDGWMLRGLEQGPVARIFGPYIVSGGWWRRRIVREYHFAETQKGEVLWVYYDRPRRRWFVQGRLE
jgi:protein ImuB